MDVRQLRYFVTIARCGSFSRAAVELNVAQPALSHHVANLEAELGVKLFDRSTRGVVPTECGHTLVTHANGILRQMAQAVRDVQQTSSDPSGTVQIGLPTSVSMELTVPLLSAVGERYPAITLKVNENYSGYLAEWVQAGELDLAVLFDVAETGPYNLTHLMTETLFLVTAPGGIADGQDSVDLARLDGLPLVVTSQSHGLRQVLERHSEQKTLTLSIKHELDSLDAIKKLVAAGHGHTVLPWCAVQSECRRGVLCAAEIRNPQILRHVDLAAGRDWPQSRAAEVVGEVVVGLVRDLVESDRMRGTLTP
ncbi:LysR family transcriptional regulator [Chachezhania antarctica]|uniref:LysR family transcriptional regulator n=1 Tax=Chachezhania antarctica TaxID=2340860 RepID=UPI000EB2999F|nr:LysR family transcriptional regulator [Chachezhania antarctica]|tara:strand:+ start:2718 stop:3644 length:927 start_codon:yes stop_codon:yes gene_type:complete